MEITWYGQSCFRLRGRGVSVITDPYCPEIGLKLPRMSATVVTISHDHLDHNYSQGVRKPDYVIAGPGEYEISDIFVIGVSTFHDSKNGKDLGRNTAYLIEFEEMTICHLGDLGHVPDQAQVEELDSVDILMVPVGGRTTLSATKAAEVVSMLEPRVVIPMHYKVKGVEASLDTPARFLREMAVDKPQQLESYKIVKTQLPETTEVIMLDLKQ